MLEARASQLRRAVIFSARHAQTKKGKEEGASAACAIRVRGVVRRLRCASAIATREMKGKRKADKKWKEGAWSIREEKTKGKEGRKKGEEGKDEETLLLG